MKLSKAALALALLLAPATASAYPNLRSFTPTSVLVPILGVELRTDDGQLQPVYACSGATPDDCLVDVADNAALDALFDAATTIDAANYTALSVVTCGAQGGYEITLQGSADVDGVAWYTSDSAVLTSNPALAGPVQVPVSGCRLEVPFPETLQVADGDVVDLSAIVVLSNLGVIGLEGSDVPLGCTVDPVRDHRVCAGYPHLVPSFGSAPPTVRRFHVTEDLTDEGAQQAQGELIALLDSKGEPFAGLTRALYLPSTVDGHTSYGSPLKRVHANGDGSYQLLNYGVSSDPDDFASYGVLFPAFSLGTHSGAMNNEVGDLVSYLAVEVP
jgi:hypothetical protein